MRWRLLFHDRGNRSPSSKAERYPIFESTQKAALALHPKFANCPAASGPGFAGHVDMHPSGYACKRALVGRGRSSLGIRRSWTHRIGSFRVQDLESNSIGSLLLLADDYNHTTNDFTTEAQSARRTHKDVEK